ncbi:TolB family protein [Solirubrobacter soli]|uniref:TolB family protein n=1 Tax=Solirubrobacter soli TaxID=363832 RepID=UPI0003F6F7DB|nr:PD40 domain-containing protein [Solirubrobacter soli]
MHSTRLFPLGLLALLAACGGTDDAPATTKAAAAQAPQPSGRIAFRRYLDQDHRQGAVFLINPDGTGERQLTHPGPAEVDDQPDFSPDGREIAFERCDSSTGACSVWRVNVDGGAATKVRIRCRLKPVCEAGVPSWTRDGRIVAQLSEGRVKQHGDVDQIERSSIVVAEPRSAFGKTIISRDHFTGDTAQPMVSPDGTKVVYMRWNSWRTRPKLGRALHVVGIDGRGDHRVTPWSLGAGDHAVWAPDGRILFRSFDGQDDKQSDFWNVAADGSGLKQLTHFKAPTLVLSASYSPDGAWIVHASDGIDGNADLYLMRADGSENRPLTRTKLWDSAPDWG